MATVLEEMGPGGVFGRNLAFAGSMGDSLEVVARSACDILFIDYPHLLRRCQNACTYHSVLVQNMLGLLSDKRAGGCTVPALDPGQAAVLFSPAG